MVLTEEQLLIQKNTQMLASKVVRPFSEQWHQEKRFPKEALQALSASGLMGMLIPEKWGGAQIDHMGYVLVIAELAKADGGLSTIVSVHNSVASLPILNYGTQKQKETFLIPMAKGEKLGAFALTEPQAGSDAGNIQTSAIQKGDHFILNGVKQFVTSGKHADIALVFATTDPKQKHHGITAFIVPTQTKGYYVSKIENKMGQHSAETAQVVLDDLHLPIDHQLGDLGQGYKIALSNLACGRLGVAAQAIGMAQEAFNLCLSYAKERITFGKLLYEHQTIHFKLADMATSLTCAEQLLFHAAHLRDNNLPHLKEAAMAKLFATEVAEKICRQAIQIYGGYGYLQDFPLERIYRDVRVTSIYEGTSDVQRMIIAKELGKV